MSRDDVHVTLKVYDILRREVATLVNERKPAGMYNAQCKMYNVQCKFGSLFIYNEIGLNYRKKDASPSLKFTNQN
jgi:hypothetical protein